MKEETKSKLITIRVTPSVKQYIQKNSLSQTKIFNDALKKVKENDKVNI